MSTTIRYFTLEKLILIDTKQINVRHVWCSLNHQSKWITASFVDLQTVKTVWKKQNVFSKKIQWNNRDKVFSLLLCYNLYKEIKMKSQGEKSAHFVIVNS
jgi:hypothetical protein